MPSTSVGRPERSTKSDACRSRFRRRLAGFSLIELVTLLGIMSIITSLVVPRFTNADSTLVAQAQRLARDLRHAQAIAMNQSRTLLFDVQSVTNYRVTFGGATITDPATMRPFSVTLANGVTLNGTDMQIDGLGRPVAGGIPLSGERVFDLDGSSHSAAVTVSPVTGFVEVSP